MNAQRAPITKLLLLANILVFFLTHSVFSDQMQSVFFTYGLLPAKFWGGQGWWMPITSIFLHANFMHILFNMVALWSLGTPMEMTLGSQRFAWLYGVSGMGGAFAVLLWHFVDPMTNPTVGASGAIFGLLGALAIFYPNSLMLFFFIPMKARTVVIVVVVVSVGLMLTDSLSILSHAGHLGGLVAGLLYSRFALGLPLMGNVLHQSGGRGPYFSGGAAGGPGPGPGRPVSPEAAAREAVNRFFGNAGAKSDVRDADPGIFTGSRRQEKVINPDPQSWTEATKVTPPPSPAPEQPRPEPIKEPPRQNTPPDQKPTEEKPAADSTRQPGTSGGKRLHFDQETGRFYFK